MVTAQEQIPQYGPSKGWLRVFTFPLVRIPEAVVFLIAAALIHNVIMMFTDRVFEGSSGLWFRDIWCVVDLAMFIIAYRFYVRIVEKRSATETSRSGALSEIGIGIGIGAVLVCVTVAVMFLANFYTIEITGSWTTFIHLARRFFPHALLEELVFRLILFRLLEEWLGTLSGFVIASAVCSLAILGIPIPRY